eukprot:2790204-Amphidinium_carterae.1
MGLAKTTLITVFHVRGEECSQAQEASLPPPASSFASSGGALFVASEAFLATKTSKGLKAPSA